MQWTRRGVYRIIAAIIMTAGLLPGAAPLSSQDSPGVAVAICIMDAWEERKQCLDMLPWYASFVCERRFDIAGLECTMLMGMV
jgi:hypothetical protein